MKKLLFALLVTLPLLAGNLQLENGSIKAHTTMMWEDIEPKNDKLSADVSMTDDDISTLSGKFWVNMKLFVSDKTDRDEHMYKEMKVDEFTTSTFTISKVSALDEKDTYSIDGTLNFYGVDKKLNAKAVIVKKEGTLTLNAESSMTVTDFGMEQVCKFFMCVNEKVDFKVEASFK